ncbi:MAG: AAA family ATPase, partial [Lachnospiraceae bacterium]|nr:AAA family ATPase [Lachnospiraceae bacterium]
PIEVKSGKEYQRHSALVNILEVTNYSIEEAFVFSNYNVEIKGNIVYYPMYMLMFLMNDEIRLPKVELADLSLL